MFKTRVGAAAAALLALVSAAMTLHVPAASAQPPSAADATIAVTTTADVVDPADGVTSLREAFNVAKTATGVVTINLAPGATYSLTRCGSPTIDEDANESGDLDVLVGVSRFVVHGNGATIASDCDGQRLVRLAGSAIAPQATIEIQNLNLVGGNGRRLGGSVYVSLLPSLTLKNVTVSGARTGSPATCTADCEANGAVAAVQNGKVAIVGTRIAGNTADPRGCTSLCIAAGGLFVVDGELTVEGTLLADNVARVSTCTNSCLLRAGGGQIEADEVTIERSAIVGNRVNCAKCVANAGAYANLYAHSATPLNLFATAIVTSGAQPSCKYVRSEVRAYYSFESGSGCSITGPGNTANGGDAKLAPLGGALPVRAPMEDSPLRNGAPRNACPAIDQRGAPRWNGDACDVGAAEFAPVEASQFVAVPPVRVFDTRPGSTGGGRKGLVGAGQTIDVQVAGVAGVPATDVTAVVMNITATGSTGGGFVTAWPAGQPRPLASNLNLTAAGQTRPNLVTVPVGAGGKVSLYSENGTHLLGDIAGYYTAAFGPQTAGRLIPLDPARVLDTRAGTPAPGAKGLVGAGQTITAKIAGNGRVPTSGVSAVVLNITATGAAAPGFVTAWPAGQPRPLASILNLNTAGDTAANLVMIPLGTDGSIQIFAEQGAHLIADVAGYFTDTTAPASRIGLYVSLPPSRVFDTRPGSSADGPKGLLSAGGVVTTPIFGRAGITKDAAAVVINLTATQTSTAGYITTYPAGVAQPLASTLNLAAGDTRANATIVRLGIGGALSHYTDPSTHLLADTTGYFLAATA